MLKSTYSVDVSIAKGIDFLERNQMPNGAFRSYCSNNEKFQTYNLPNEGWCFQDDNIFTTILAGSSLTFLASHSKVDQMLSNITDFLLAQRKIGKIWNHYTSNHSLFHLCPFDVDDTACASSLLKQRGVAFPSNIDVILSNRNSKRLFYTWFTLRLKLNLNPSYLRVSLRELKRPVKSLIFWSKMKCSRNDVDAVVNANVLYYLGRRDETLPVINFIIDIIKQEKEGDCDKWYRNIFTVYYFISKNYFAGITEFEAIRQLIIQRIIDTLNPDNSFGGSVLDTALAICTLLNFNYSGDLSASIFSLINNQQPDGSWERSFFYYAGPKKHAGFGSEELSTAICLEALNRHAEFIITSKTA